MGFAFGVERLNLVSTMALSLTAEKKLVFLITLGESARKEGAKVLARLRRADIPCDTDYAGKSLKGAMRAANDLGAALVLILGEDELKKNVITLKSMASGEQKEIRLEDLTKELKCSGPTTAGSCP
jgi:histidyl-tRNA synthetase